MKQACAMILTVLLLLAVFGTGEATNLTTDYVVADNNYAEVSRADN